MPGKNSIILYIDVDLHDSLQEESMITFLTIISIISSIPFKHKSILSDYFATLHLLGDYITQDFLAKMGNQWSYVWPV